MKRCILYLLLIIAVPASAQPGVFGRKAPHTRYVERRHPSGPLIHSEQHGYSAPHREVRGMNPRDFEAAYKLISEENFDDRRLTTAKRIVSVNPMSARQIASICKLFSFDSNRLEFAKFAYGHCVDANRYFLIDETFTFRSSKDELYEYITR